MAYNLSSFAGAGAQFFDDNGNVLSGGKIYTYAAGTTTPATTYTGNTGASSNPNPIVLDAAGRTPAEIWLTVGQQMKFVVKTSTDTLIGTYDNVPPINDSFSTNSTLSNVIGINNITAELTPPLAAYATGEVYSFISLGANTGAMTLSISGLTAKNVTKVGNIALTAGDVQSGEMVRVIYDGTRFQLLGNVVYGGSVTNATITGLVTDISIADGGTGASTAAAAFDNLKQAATDAYVGAVELATAVEAAAGTDSTRAITPSTLRGGLNATGSAPVFACRAWVNFNGTGTVAIRASGNVSSITDNGTGNYTVNFTTDMPHANFSVCGSCADVSAGKAYLLAVSSEADAYYKSWVRLYTSDNNSETLMDSPVVNVAVFC